MINSVAPRETAGVTTRLILTYVRHMGGDEAVTAVLQQAGESRPAAELETEHGWSSYDQKISLFAAAAEVLNDPDVATRVGASVLQTTVGTPLRLLIRALGSPGGVLRNIAKVAPRFSTVCTMEALDVRRGHALIRYHLHDGYTPSRFDCDYNIGLLSQAPALFGRPPARVEHPACQARGANACVYEVRWKTRYQRRNVHTRIRELEEQLRVVADRAEDLQSSIADLVSIDDLDELLHKIAQRAGVAVGAQAYVLAVRPTHDSEVRVHSDGLSAEQADKLAASLVGLADEDGDDARLVVEVASSRRRYGRLAALNPRGGSFFPEEKRLFAAYARNAAAALDAATALEEARQRGETAMVLLDVSRSVAKATTVDQVAKAIADAVPAVCTGDRSAVVLWDADTGTAEVRAWHGFDPQMDAMLGGLTVTVDDTPELYRMLAEPAPRRYIAGEVGDPYVDGMMAMFGTGEMHVVPILRSGEFLGAVICASGSEGMRMTPMMAGRLSGVADLAAVALDNVRLLERERKRSAALHVQAYRDPVTGLPNRRLFDDRLHLGVSHALRAGENLAVLYLDIDNFKMINDTLGHHAGDVLLHELGGRLSKCLRQEDTLARVGGDEFALIIPRCARPRDAARVAAKIVAAAGQPYRIAGQIIRASVSVGGALAPMHGTDTRVLLNKADRAMYAAKTSGGNMYRPYDETLDLTATG